MIETILVLILYLFITVSITVWSLFNHSLFMLLIYLGLAIVNLIVTLSTSDDTDNYKSMNYLIFSCIALVPLLIYMLVFKLLKVVYRKVKKNNPIFFL